MDLTSAYKLINPLNLSRPIQAYSPKYKLTYPPDVKESHLSNRHWPKPPQKSSDRQRSCPSRGGPAITVWAYSLKQHLLRVFLIIFVPTCLGSQDYWLRVPSGEQGMETCAYNLSTWEEEAQRLAVWGKSGLYRPLSSLTLLLGFSCLLFFLSCLFSVHMLTL